MYTKSVQTAVRGPTAARQLIVADLQLVSKNTLVACRFLIKQAAFAFVHHAVAALQCCAHCQQSPSREWH